MEEILSKAGLSRNEAKVYLVLLESGESLASRIAKETNLNRSLVYRILEDLIKKGFVGYVIKENRKYFNAASPNKLLDIIKENEREIKKIIPELLKVKKPVGKAPEVEVYSGKEGMKTVLEDVLRTEKEVLVFGAKSDFANKLIYYHPNWHRRRVKLKLKMRALFEHGQKITKELIKLSHTEIKILPEELKSKIMFAVFGNKVAIELWFNYPTTILIEDSNVANGFRNYFKFLWKQSK